VSGSAAITDSAENNEQPWCNISVDQEPSTSNSEGRDSSSARIGTHPKSDLKTEHVALQSHIERTLTKLWQDVLGLNEVGMDDNFFELGGQSLMAVVLLSEIEEVFGGQFSLASLIAAPTIHKFSEIVSKGQRSHRDASGGTDLAIVERKVRSFIVENYLFDRENDLRDTDSLLARKVIGPMGFLQIAAFVEGTYGIEVKDEELTRANMDSINNVSAYVRRKLKGEAEEHDVRSLRA
jgi:acyl carrier protein